MEKPSFEINKKFSSLEEEVAYLRGEIAKKEKAFSHSPETRDAKLARERALHGVVAEYGSLPESVLHKNYAITPDDLEHIVLDLSPEEHDSKMEELLTILQAKGIKNTLRIVEKMRDPHIWDDFHRFLVQYMKKGFPVRGIQEKTPIFKSLKMSLYEVLIAESGKEEKQKTLKEFVAGMEQFYAGMLSVAGGSENNYISLEIANAHGSEEFVFYVAVPDSKKDLFEKQILAIFPDAKIEEKTDDYNIFGTDHAEVSASYATSARNAVFPLKTYEQFEYDPLNILLNSFSKIKKEGEGAALQILFSPAGDTYVKKYKRMLEKLEQGKKLKEVIRQRGVAQKILVGAVEFIDDLIGFKPHATPDKEKLERQKKDIVEENRRGIELIKEKIQSPIANVDIRVIAAARDISRAKAIRTEIESSFNQFDNPHGNRLSWNALSGSKLKHAITSFSFRTPNSREHIALNLKELATLLHFHTRGVEATSQLKQSKAGTAPAPVGGKQEGTLIGINKFRNQVTRAYITPDDRLRHFYVIGQTGTGKSTLLKNMIIQDIKAGHGVCMIDPHGVDIQDVLANIPKERFDDLIYFDPSHIERPMALNMLEYDVRFPEQKTFVVNEMLSIFNKLFDMKVAGGPMFEQYFRNAVLLTIEDPESGNTLLDVSKVLANKSFRDMKLSKCKNPIVVQFWREVAEKAGGEASLQNMVPYITSKFDAFLSNDIMRPIIAQAESSFNFREVMDNKKILLVNLAKGRLGDINAHLIGLILVGKILMAALSRVDSLGANLPPFYLYIDEFQNVTTSSISTILSEARKYKLSLTVAHQFIAQLEEDIKNAVFGNVGSIAAFRVGSEDAEFLAKQFEPVFTAQDLVNIDNRNAYVKLLVEGRPVKPFNIETLPPPPGIPSLVEKLKELSYLKFGKSKEEVEAEIISKYSKVNTTSVV